MQIAADSAAKGFAERQDRGQVWRDVVGVAEEQYASAAAAAAKGTMAYSLQYRRRHRGAGPCSV